MSFYMNNGWLRILRKLTPQVVSDVKGYISLIVENEDLGIVAQNVWVSPTSGVKVGDSKNFDYVDGNIAYTGVRDALIQVDFYQSITVGGGVNSSAEIACGVNTVPDTNGIMPSSSSFGGELLQVTECRQKVSNGDTIDAFVRQTSEVGGANITIVKGIYHVQIIEGL